MKNIYGLPLIAACLVSSAAVSNAQIVNGGFETGDFTGWTASANSFPMDIVTSPVNSGTYAAQIAGFAFNPDTLSQTVATGAGQDYTLSFWRYIADGNPTTLLDVYWDNTLKYSELNTGPFNAYSEISFNVVGTGSDTLEFVCANDPSFTYLDDVSLTPGVPDGGTTVALLGLALTGIAGFRRKSSPK